MEMNLLLDIVIIFGVSVAILFACQRLHVPSIVGFLLAGIVIGPSGLKFISGVHHVESLSEIGIILLLFTIGIDFSLKQLSQIKKVVLAGGSIQVVLTILISFLIALGFGFQSNESMFIGFLVALSSTVIVLKIFQEKAQIDSPHGRISLGILIFQDIIIVPMILLTSLLSGKTGLSFLSFIVLVAKGVAIISLVIIVAKWLVPQILYQITRTRSYELFLLSVVVICFSVAWLTYIAGLSLALGAFLAGLIISETEYSHSALGNILPFKSIFSTFFFVSVGLMLDLSFLYGQLPVIVVIVLAIIILKALITIFTVLILGYPLRTSILVGFAICQIGEFSLILSRIGVEQELFSTTAYQMLLSATLISMAITPFLMNVAPRVADYLTKVPVLKKYKSKISDTDKLKIVHKKGHLIIIGFGVTGRNVARAAKAANIPYVILEMNPETVHQEQKKGEPIIFGDATYESVLRHINIDDAKIILVAINDPSATRRIIEVARQINQNVHLIVRTRYIPEVKQLYELGADEVVPEEFETSVEIFTRILNKYLVPKDDIELLVSEIRADGYAMLRQLSSAKISLSDLKLQLDDFDISSMKILEGSPLIGKTLANVNFRKRFGVSVVAIKQGSKLFPNPEPDTLLTLHDILYIIGTKEQLAEAQSLFA